MNLQGACHSDPALSVHYSQVLPDPLGKWQCINHYMFKVKLLGIDFLVCIRNICVGGLKSLRYTPLKREMKYGFP